MRYLRLKAEEVNISGSHQSTASIVAACVNNPPKGGFSPDVMRSRIRVLDALEDANGVLTLEDADAKTLSKCVAEMRWTICAQGILDFVDLVADLPSEAPE